MKSPCRGTALLLVLAGTLGAQASDSLTRAYSATQCPPCAEWNAPTAPVRLFGNTYYVGTRGLASLLITSDSGHVLVDAGLPESAPRIMANIRALGFRVEDIRLIVTSHVHYDHAGGVAAIQRASGARVAASEWSAKVLETGKPLPDDPQYAIALAYPRVSGTRVQEVKDGDTLRVGPLAVTAHFTPGHTPGGTTWTWRSCEGRDCRDFVYADSQTPVSAEGFRFSDSRSYPRAVQDFERSFAVLSALSCDILVTPHPSASRLWERLEKNALRDTEACRRYAANARRQLNQRLARERTGR
jgi:metallo-beta-lactamase class B